MKIVFAGSPNFAIPTLERLVAAGYQVIAVYTQPDRPVGRSQQLQSPPVKLAAQRLGLRIEQPERIRRDESRAVLEDLRPEVMVVVGYGQILPPWLLELPRYGCVNLHASLLPAYRGAAPIQWAIANGEPVTGNTTMQMDPGMDTGHILLQQQTAIGPDETAPQLAERLSLSGADLMIETLEGIVGGTLPPRPQDNSRATKAPILKREDGLIDWNWSARKIYNRLRGFDPWPGIYCLTEGRRLTIAAARPQLMETFPAGLAPGTVAQVKPEVIIACGENSALLLEQVQPEGRRQMTAREYLNGAKLAVGSLLSS
jgi:methionyl-tRNA formyltransferase